MQIALSIKNNEQSILLPNIPEPSANVKIIKLLSKGYFPKELPPGFNTEQFGAKATYVWKKWNAFEQTQKAALVGESNANHKLRVKTFDQKYGSSTCTIFNYPKNLLSRRDLQIPNPKQFHDLANALVNNWKQIRSLYKLTSFSASSPVELEARRSIRTKSKTFNNFQFELIQKSFNKRYELKVDISQFYPTIYTHSIPWAILGKSVAKDYFLLKNTPGVNWQTILATDPVAARYKMADQIDMLVRNCQERQSIGIPVGPDSSFILAEIIGARIDSEIKNQLTGFEYECLRYYDDYYFYTNTYSDAEQILKVTQRVLNDYQLKVNEAKILIERLPNEMLVRWSRDISSFHFTQINKFTLRNFFSLLISLINEFPKESSWITEYGLSRFQYGNIVIARIDWDFFLELLLKLVQLDSSNIDQVFNILWSYEDYLDSKSKKKLKLACEQLIEEHLLLRHSFEVSWLLWIIKTFDINCKAELLTSILDSGDNISRIISLDLITSRSYSGATISLNFIENTLSHLDLWTQNWLFTYESIAQNWLNPTNSILDHHEYFRTLNYYGVKFYDPFRQKRKEFSIPRDLPELDFGELFEDTGEENTPVKIQVHPVSVPNTSGRSRY